MPPTITNTMLCQITSNIISLLPICANPSDTFEKNKSAKMLCLKLVPLPFNLEQVKQSRACVICRVSVVVNCFSESWMERVCSVCIPIGCQGFCIGNASVNKSPACAIRKVFVVNFLLESWML